LQPLCNAGRGLGRDELLLVRLFDIAETRG
jgi:hypothetical protein